MNNIELSDIQQACLLIVRNGNDNVLDRSWENITTSLLQLGLIQYKPNIKDELMLTITGEDCLMKGVMIRYPLHGGNVGNYNDILRSMTEPAVNALVCAMMQERIFDKVPKITARVLGQHLLDIKMWKLWGSILLGKWQRQCDSSMRHFSSYGKKNESKQRSKHNDISKKR